MPENISPGFPWLEGAGVWQFIFWDIPVFTVQDKNW